MSAEPRIGVVGPTTLLGKEVATAIRERGLSSRPLRLLRAGGATPAKPGGDHGRGLLAIDDEPVVLDELDLESAADLDMVFLAAPGEEAVQAWRLLRQRPGGKIPHTVDLTGSLVAETGGGALVVTPHPAAVALAEMLIGLRRVGELRRTTAVVFEPASERGLEGLQALERQTVRMLALQGQAESVFDAPIAFTLRAALGPEARPSLAQVRQRITGDIRRLLADSPGEGAPGMPAIELLQAPLFHATVLSLQVGFAAAPAFTEGLQRGFEAAFQAAVSPDLPGHRERFVWHETYPDTADAANQTAIQLGPVRAELDPPGGFWLFATLDNLRRTALHGVDAARRAWEVNRA